MVTANHRALTVLGDAHRAHERHRLGDMMSNAKALRLGLNSVKRDALAMQAEVQHWMEDATALVAARSEQLTLGAGKRDTADAVASGTAQVRNQMDAAAARFATQLAKLRATNRQLEQQAQVRPLTDQLLGEQL